MIDTKKFANFIKLKNVNPLMNWEDIKEGETYHIPPLIYNKRMDFVVVEKKKESMRIRKLNDTYTQILFKTDITTRFITKKQNIYGSSK